MSAPKTLTGFCLDASRTQDGRAAEVLHDMCVWPNHCGCGCHEVDA